MIKGKNVIGLKVMSVAEGKDIGKVKDIVYDSNSHEVKALIVDEGGMFSDATVLLIPDIQSIGKDMVLIPNQSAVKKASEADKVVSETTGKDQYLTNTKIVSEDGTDLGKVTDIFFDPESGKVREFEVSQGLIGDIQSGKKRVRVEDILTVGENATIVKAYTQDQFSEQGKQQGLTGALETVKNEAPNITRDIKDKALDLGQQANEKAQEIKSNPEVQKTMTDIQHKAEDAGDKIRQTADEVKDKIQDKTQEIKQNPDIEKAKDEVREKGEDIADTVKDTTREIADEAEQKADKIQYSPAVQNTTENAEKIEQESKAALRQKTTPPPSEDDETVIIDSPADNTVTTSDTKDPTQL